MSQYLSVKEISLRASMSERTILKYLHEIRHHRNSPRGKVWIKWEDFEEWMDSRARAVRGDEEVMEFLQELKGA